MSERERRREGKGGGVVVSAAVRSCPRLVHEVQARNRLEAHAEEMDPQPGGALADVSEREDIEVAGGFDAQVVAAGAVGPEEDRTVEDDGVGEQVQANLDESDVHDGVDTHLGIVREDRGRTERTHTQKKISAWAKGQKGIGGGSWRTAGRWQARAMRERSFGEDSKQLARRAQRGGLFCKRKSCLRRAEKEAPPEGASRAEWWRWS